MADPYRHDGRAPHAYGLDRQGRTRKAAKIRSLLERRQSLAGADLLEVGCGSGWMAHQWSQDVGPTGSVQAVDLVDQRRVHDGFSFTQVDGTTLPFPDRSFDMAVSNHVLEHVGERTSQHHHLAELHRVLRPDGVLYLAVPNRWRIMEPHYKLPLLSWLPQRASDAYLRAAGRGSWYDVEPPSQRTMRELWKASAFTWEDVTLLGVREMRTTEDLSMPANLVAGLPSPVLALGSWWVPTMLYLATPQ